MTNPRYDLTKTAVAAEELLEQTDDPLHRKILENYRQHAFLEVSGRYDDVCAENMMVDDAHYLLAFGGEQHDLRGREEIREFYAGLVESGGEVMVVTDEELVVYDCGFAHEANFHQYLRGADLIADGIEVDDPDGYYIHHFTLAGMWHYDPTGRLIGEHLGEIGHREIEPIAADEFITPADAREILEPLIEPFTPLDEPKPGAKVNRFYDGGVGKPVTMD